MWQALHSKPSIYSPDVPLGTRFQGLSPSKAEKRQVMVYREALALGHTRLLNVLFISRYMYIN